MGSRRWIKIAMMAAVCALAARGGEKKLMHCFAWTEIKEATPADWDAFRTASDAIPSKIKVVTRVWYGPLANPLSQTMLAKIDPEAFNAEDIAELEIMILAASKDAESKVNAAQEKLTMNITGGMKIPGLL